ncbi:T9SS type A sorting domain-containing protein [Hymenobacter sp. DG25A]|uniref:T9SS type A sorting domain-containing protein n=1 Tax=Hymenobacter sp. DG25A TaxID=1385663 RepID=UPI001E2E08B8|nr:T9SS type A sorting domain-containing protein [Hymenobacter sp. DG25A]
MTDARGCTTTTSATVGQPTSLPAAPTLGVVNNCDNSTVTATNLVAGSTLTWSDGGTGNPRTVTSTTALTVTQTVNGCTSPASNSVTPAPKPTPAAPVLGVVNNCDNSTVTATNLVAGSTLTWSDGGSGNPRTVTSTTALTVRQTVNGCISPASNSITPAPKPTPAAPVLGVVNNCDNSTVTATNLVAGSTLTWSDGGTGNPRTVTSTTALTVTQTVNGCTSPASNSVTPAPKPTPGAPTLNVVNNCGGTSTITATNYTGTLTWSDGGSGNPRTVSSSSGSLTVTQTINGCTSPASNSATPAQRPTPPAPVVTVQEATLCGTLAKPTLTVCSPVSGSTYILKQPNESDKQILFSGTDPVVFTNLVAGKGFSVTSTSSEGCISSAATCGDQVGSCPNSLTATNQVQQASTKVELQQRSIQTEAYPNPTGRDATINFSVPRSGHVKVDVYNALGSYVTTLYDGDAKGGENNAVVLKGAQLPTGTYYYKVTSDGKTKTNRISLVK